MKSHSACIASWLKALREDKNEIFRAAADAQRICDYLQDRALKAAPSLPAEAESAESPAAEEGKALVHLATARPKARKGRQKASA